MSADDLLDAKISIQIIFYFLEIIFPDMDKWESWIKDYRFRLKNRRLH
jgi:hypothetical protein